MRKSAFKFRVKLTINLIDSGDGGYDGHYSPTKNDRIVIQMQDEKPIKPIMHQREIDALTSFLLSATSYFEYGMGGSTMLAGKTVKGPIYAIDSDKIWVEKIKRAMGPRELGANFRTVDIGPTGAWGSPIGRDHIEKFPSYSFSIEDFPAQTLDFVLVDGRFRVSCFLTALLNVRSDTVVAIHDYTSRAEYHLVEEFARPISICAQLVFFVKRHDFDKKKAVEIRNKFIKDSA